MKATRHPHLVNAPALVRYAESGNPVCAFEAVHDRRGIDPDRLVPHLTRAGLLLPDGEAPDLGIGEQQRLVQTHDAQRVRRDTAT